NHAPGADLLCRDHERGAAPRRLSPAHDRRAGRPETELRSPAAHRSSERGCPRRSQERPSRLRRIGRRKDNVPPDSRPDAAPLDEKAPRSWAKGDGRIPAMAEGLNRVMLLGNLGADPELRYTQSGQAVLNMRIATTESYLDRNKVRQERTDWHNVVL